MICSDPRRWSGIFITTFLTGAATWIIPISAGTLGHDDTLLNLLSVNPNATEEFRRCHGALPNLYLRQSFMAAAKAFKSIDAPTRGVIVPYGEEGKAIINELCAAFAIEKQFDLLRKAQQYTVNVFPHELRATKGSSRGAGSTGRYGHSLS